MVYTLVSFLGCIFGYIIARFTKEELKPGLIYFKISELVILLILSLSFLYSSFNLILLLTGIIFGIFLRFEYLYFGLGVISSLNFLTSALVFIYGLFYGSLIFYYKKWKNLVYSLILFFLGFLVYFLDYNILSFAAGGLLSLFFIKFWKIFHL